MLQPVTDGVKRDLRAERKARTEAQLVAAATELFVERGWSGTTLGDVAARAGVADRTVYVRFATKADLLHRCIDVAIGGGAPDVPIDDRDWMLAAMGAPTRDERIERMAAATASLMARAGRLVDVARQAAPSEPSIAERADAARAQTHAAMQRFWQAMASDGLLRADVDLEWLTETASLLAQAETYLLVTATSGWDVATFESWLVTSWRRLVVASASAS